MTLIVRRSVACLAAGILALAIAQAAEVHRPAAVAGAAKPQPVELKKDQTERLLALQAAVTRAALEVEIAKRGQEAATANFNAGLTRIALELKLDLDTHELLLEDVAPGRYAFTVKTATVPGVTKH
jgi:hypothetical protein